MRATSLSQKPIEGEEILTPFQKWKLRRSLRSVERMLGQRRDMRRRLFPKLRIMILPQMDREVMGMSTGFDVFLFFPKGLDKGTVLHEVLHTYQYALLFWDEVIRFSIEWAIKDSFPLLKAHFPHLSPFLDSQWEWFPYLAEWACCNRAQLRNFEEIIYLFTGKRYNTAQEFYYFLHKPSSAKGPKILPYWDFPLFETTSIKARSLFKDFS